MAVRWQVREIKTNSDGGVTYVHLCAWDEEVSTEGGATRRIDGYWDGAYEFTPDPSASGYTNLEDLTEDQVLTWCKSLLGTDGVAEKEAAVAAQIEAKKSESQSTAFPWS